MATRNIYLNGVIDENTPQYVREQIEQSEEDTIDIYIASNGGSVNAGIEIANFIQGVNNKSINTHIISNADSIASVIFLGAEKNNRHAVSSSQFMIHNPSVGILMENLNPSDTQKLSEVLNFQKDRLLNFYENRISGLAREKISSMMDEETYILAEQLVEFGAINPENLLEKFDIAAYNKDFINQKTNKMNLFSKKVKNTIVFADNTVAIFEGDTIAKGTELEQTGSVDKLDGEYKADGNTYKVANNVVEEITEDAIEEPKGFTSEDASNLKAEILNEVSEKLTPIQDSISKVLEGFESLKNETPKNQLPNREVKNTLEINPNLSGNDKIGRLQDAKAKLLRAKNKNINIK